MQFVNVKLKILIAVLSLLFSIPTQNSQFIIQKQKMCKVSLYMIAVKFIQSIEILREFPPDPRGRVCIHPFVYLSHSRHLSRDESE